MNLATSARRKSASAAILLSLVLIGGAPALTAQQVFVAPSQATIFAESEESQGAIPAHILFITNRSTIPIIIFGISLTNCENIKQWCGGNKTDVRIEPGQRRNVFRVEPKSSERGFNYRWNYSYRPDSADAKAMAALREHGVDGSNAPRPNMRPVVAETTWITRGVLDTAPRVFIPVRKDPEPTSRPTFRFKVAYGSILGSNMTPGTPTQLTGACIDPQEAKRYEADGKITRTPWRPALLARGADVLMQPVQLADSAIKEGDPLVRFVVDTTGDVIPESISVLESPHGEVSVAACKTAMQARATPAKDKDGRTIRAWVQMPLQMLRRR